MYSNWNFVGPRGSFKESAESWRIAKTKETICMCAWVLSHSVVSDSVTSWPADLQAPLSKEFPRPRTLEWLSFPTPHHLPNPGIEPTSPVSYIGRWVIYHWATWEAQRHAEVGINLEHLFLSVYFAHFQSLIYHGFLLLSSCFHRAETSFNLYQLKSQTSK